jgi:hypothetical protein
VKTWFLAFALSNATCTATPRWPCDNTWIPPPAPDTWEFIKEIGRGTDAPMDEAGLPARLAAKNGIVERFESSAEGDQFLNQTSEVGPLFYYKSCVLFYYKNFLLPDVAWKQTNSDFTS